MSTRTPVPNTPLLEWYSKLQQPGGWSRLQTLIDRLPHSQRPGHPRPEVLPEQIDKICHYLTAHELVESAVPAFDKLLLNGSYAGAVLFCGKVIDGQRYPVAIIIRAGEGLPLSGICYVPRRTASGLERLSLSNFVEGLVPAFEHAQTIPV